MGFFKIQELITNREGLLAFRKKTQATKLDKFAPPLSTLIVGRRRVSNHPGSQWGRRAR